MSKCDKTQVLRGCKCVVGFGLSSETEARVRKFCKENGLTFDDGVNFLLDRVAQPKHSKTSLRDAHTGHSESAAKKSRATRTERRFRALITP